MKHLFLALFCTIIGVGAFAGNPVSKTTGPAVNKVEVVSVSNQKTAAKTTAKSSFVIQRVFQITDMCGNTWNIYVSGGSYVDAYGAAVSWAYNNSVGCL
jgi:hypothetical protein